MYILIYIVIILREGKPIYFSYAVNIHSVLCIYGQRVQLLPMQKSKIKLNFPHWTFNLKTQSDRRSEGTPRSSVTHQRVGFHGAGRSLLVRPLLQGLSRAAGADAGRRQVEELGLVLLCRRPRQRAPHPLHRVFPGCLLSVGLAGRNTHHIQK